MPKIKGQSYMFNEIFDHPDSKGDMTHYYMMLVKTPSPITQLRLFRLIDTFASMTKNVTNN